MKKIEAIIKPFRLEEVKAALADLGVEGMTVLEARGLGRQRGHNGLAQEREIIASSRGKVRIDLILEDSQVDAAVKAIVVSAKTGKIGDGKVCISTIDEVVLIRNEEKGERAL